MPQSKKIKEIPYFKIMNIKSSYLRFNQFNIVLLLILVFFVITDSLKACTAFCMKKNGQVLLAKNLDWPVGAGIILINKRGVPKTAYNDHEKKLTWRSKYGSITFNQFGKEYEYHEPGAEAESVFIDMARYGNSIKCKR